jgi:FMN-dependent NADH-azoreductase
MSRVLLIISSPRGAASYSTRVGRALADKLAGAQRHSKVSERNLSQEPLPHIDESFTSALYGAVATPEQKAALALSDALLQEFFAADVIVIAAAMINFTIPSTLKAYLDYILRAGSTFKYTEQGPEGLVKGKKVYLALARGGIYSEGPMQAFNFQDTYLKTVLGFIGITDIEVIAVEGVMLGPEIAEKSFAAALAAVGTVAV